MQQQRPFHEKDKQIVKLLQSISHRRGIFAISMMDCLNEIFIFAPLLKTDEFHKTKANGKNQIGPKRPQETGDV
jgi:hypothetical protein